MPRPARIPRVSFRKLQRAGRVNVVKSSWNDGDVETNVSPGKKFEVSSTTPPATTSQAPLDRDPYDQDSSLAHGSSDSISTRLPSGVLTELISITAGPTGRQLLGLTLSKDNRKPRVTYQSMSLLESTSVLVGASTVTALLLATSLTMGLFSKNQMPVAGRNVIVTGASQGMGKAVALLLASQGANVAIVARDQKKLDAAGAEIQAVIDANGTKYLGQKLAVISADLSDPQQAQRALSDAESQLGDTEILWCCAGGANPGFFTNYEPADLQWSMNTNYWSAVYIAHAAVKAMSSRPPPPSKGAPQRKVIFTSSIAALCPIIGYSSYVGPKAALRALTDCLRQECLLYDIGVHCCCPGSIESPGLVTENLTKPDLTKKIEESDVVQKPEVVAKACLDELQNGQTLPVPSFLARAARAGMAGPTPRANAFVELIFSWIAAIVFIFVRWDQDSIVMKERKKGLPWQRTE
ncbi:LOW QUALITY PROTEIN: hypothetical protein Dda_8236 [Drechslerella dactyloides]|uniref:3-dehydrosphinganine reductase n=1 Tax=Drechslerella dactyloides TaxID=74499 RepID=A0AAD6NGI4_DREDA|nr:LOW QUALITY PROTEIN: hypothetical protein Dda_8236 [Drechslerella dactyloides]